MTAGLAGAFAVLVFAAGLSAATQGTAHPIALGATSAEVSLAELPEGWSNPRTPEQAVAWALSQVGVARDSGHCLRFVDLAYGHASGPPSAYLVWTQSPPMLHRVRDFNPPRGALVVWSSGLGGGHGHIAIALGDGRMVSTTESVVSVIPIAGYADQFYYGWMPPYFYM